MANSPYRSISDKLFLHANKHAQPFRSHEGLACASIPFAPFAHDVQPLRSRLFEEWLIRTFYKEHEIFPSRHAIRAATNTFEALATDPETPRRSIDLRVSAIGEPLRPNAMLLDLANDQGDAIEITAGGWNIRQPTNSFRRSRNTQPLPEPRAADAPDNSPLTLPGFALNPACLAWLLAALRPAGPYPILILHGPSASGKTLLARMLRSLVDPASSTVCRAPRNQRDLLRLAWNNYVLVFDHSTDLPPDIAESLCRLSSGAGFAFDEMTDGSDALFRLERPIILTLPNSAGKRFTELRHHAILVHMPPIAHNTRRGATELIDKFYEARPSILARLCTALSAAMSTISAAAAADSLPAFVDAATWAITAAPSLGIPANEMRAALTVDAFTRDLAAFVHENGSWEGTTTDLLAVLQAHAIADLPSRASALSHKINNSQLGIYGVTATRTRTHTGSRSFRLTLAHEIAVKTAKFA